MKGSSSDAKIIKSNRNPVNFIHHHIRWNIWIQCRTFESNSFHMNQSEMSSKKTLIKQHIRCTFLLLLFILVFCRNYLSEDFLRKNNRRKTKGKQPRKIFLFGEINLFFSRLNIVFTLLDWIIIKFNSIVLCVISNKKKEQNESIHSSFVLMLAL